MRAHGIPLAVSSAASGVVARSTSKAIPQKTRNKKHDVVFVLLASTASRNEIDRAASPSRAGTPRLPCTTVKMIPYQFQVGYPQKGGCVSGRVKNKRIQQAYCFGIESTVSCGATKHFFFGW